MGGHGHGEPYKIPHPSIYKVENVPILKEVQESLGRQGLKDPWLRNEAWRYEPKNMGTHATRARAFFLRGFVWGFAAFAITVGAEYAVGKMGGGGDHGHGHGHGHGEEKTEGH